MSAESDTPLKRAWKAMNPILRGSRDFDDFESGWEAAQQHHEAELNAAKEWMRKAGWLMQQLNEAQLQRDLLAQDIEEMRGIITKGGSAADVLRFLDSTRVDGKEAV